MFTNLAQNVFVSTKWSLVNLLASNSPSYIGFIHKLLEIYTVEHNDIIRACYNIGVRGRYSNGFKSYLKNRSGPKWVWWCKSNSVRCPARPQGSQLGPVLFIIFNEVLQNMKNHQILQLSLYFEINSRLQRTVHRSRLMNLYQIELEWWFCEII